MVAITSLIDILNKPALLKWANKIGLEGIRLSDYRKEVTTEGSNSHQDIEDYLKHGIDFPDSDILQKNLEGYEVVGCEVEVKNEHLIGRVDLILKKNNQIYVCDFKRGKNIYLSTKLQLSAYKHLFGADKIAFINTESFKIHEVRIDTLKYYEIVKRLYQINSLISDLKERL